MHGKSFKKVDYEMRLHGRYSKICQSLDYNIYETNERKAQKIDSWANSSSCIYVQY